MGRCYPHLPFLKATTCLVIGALGLVFLITAKAVADSHAEASPADHAVIMATVAPSWIRVTSDADVIVFEGVLEASEGAAFPDEQHNLRYMSGNPSAVYFWIGDDLYGPAGEGATVIRDASLSPSDIRESFDLVALAELSPQHRSALEHARDRYDE